MENHWYFPSVSKFKYTLCSPHGISSLFFEVLLLLFVFVFVWLGFFVGFFCCFFCFLVLLLVLKTACRASLFSIINRQKALRAESLLNEGTQTHGLVILSDL